MTIRSTAPSVDSSVPNNPQATLPGIQDPVLPASPLLAQIPSPVGGQPSGPVGTSPVPNGTSSRLVTGSSSPAAPSVRVVAPPSRPSLSSVKPTTLSPRSFPSAGATHKSGSISHGETFERLTAHLGREPEPHELFMYTHTRKHDGSSWIDQHAQDVEEEYAQIVAEIESQQNHADELQAFFQAVGGANNRNKIYGFGAAGSRYFNSASSYSSGTNGASSSTTSSDPRLHMQSQLDRLQSAVDELIALQQ